MYNLYNPFTLRNAPIQNKNNVHKFIYHFLDALACEDRVCIESTDEII